MRSAITKLSLAETVVWERTPLLLARLGLSLLLVGPAIAQDEAVPTPVAALASDSIAAVSAENLGNLNTAFDFLYNLDFEPAFDLFEYVTNTESNSAVAPAFWSSALLYRMLAEQGSLQSQLFATNAFLREPPPVDAELQARYLEVREISERRAETRLQRDPDDVDGLFALGLTRGNSANYAAGVEGEYVKGLRALERAVNHHSRLREIRPDIRDTGIVLGVHDYVIGSLPSFVRFLLFIVGSRGDAEQGLDYLRDTAENGEFLAPYGKVLLAMAYIRENELSAATSLAESLSSRYPRNPLLRLELAKLYREQQAYDDASELIEALLAEIPTDAENENLSSAIRDEVLNERERLEELGYR